MATALVNKTAKMPIFDFMIPEEGFYVSTPGLSVTDTNKSFSSMSDGKFYIMNRNNTSIYFNKLVVSKIQSRNASRTDNFTISLYDRAVDTDYLYEIFYIYYAKSPTSSTRLATTITNKRLYSTTDTNVIGKLTLRTNLNNLDGSNIRLLPFQSIEFAVSYEVINTNNLSWQYYGKTKSTPNIRKGTIDITFGVHCFGDQAFTVEIIDSVVVSINLINTGYIPTIVQPHIIILPTTPQSKGGIVVPATPNHPQIIIPASEEEPASKSTTTSSSESESQ